MSAGYLNRSPAYMTEHGHGLAFDLDLNVTRRFGFHAKIDRFSVAYKPRTTGDVRESGFDVGVWRFALGPRLIQRWNRVSLFEHVLLTAHISEWGAFPIGIRTRVLALQGSGRRRQEGS
jgi:hypothetical protein